MAASFLLKEKPPIYGMRGLRPHLARPVKVNATRSAAAGLSSGHGERREARLTKFIADLVSPHPGLAAGSENALLGFVAPS